MKDRYIIGECPRCHTLIIVDSRYKSKTCHKCNLRIGLSELKILHTAHNSRDARTIIAEAKALRGRPDQR